MTEVAPTTAEPAAAATDSLLTPASPADAPQSFGDWRDDVPSKFMKDGEVDHANLVKSYKHLEAKMGAGENPPSDAAGYQFKAPEGVEETDEFKAMVEEHKARAHEIGLNQKQFEEYTADLYEMAGEIRSEFAQTPEKATAALKGEWGDKFDANLALAQKAFQRYGNGVDIADVGNNPAALKLLAAIGNELREDSKPAHGQAVNESLAQLRADPDYTNPHSPRYQILQNKVLELTRQRLAN